MRDLVRRIRRHPSIGIYCGRNEGFPPKPIDDGIRQAVAELHPGMRYIPNSAFMTVSGGGPYRAMTPGYYFRTADTRLHSEIGAPTIPPIESVRLMMPESALWPQGLDWGLHDFCSRARRPAPVSAPWSTTAMAEPPIFSSGSIWPSSSPMKPTAASSRRRASNRMGALLWMSHPCWPSFVWQTYDYYFEPTAAYFGCKKASEPIHIQWNREHETIEVVNYNAGNQAGLTAKAEIFNINGTRMGQKTATLDSREDSTESPIHMDYPSGLTPVHFLRLTLSRGSQIVSANFYLRGSKKVTTAPFAN